MHPKFTGKQQSTVSRSNRVLDIDPSHFGIFAPDISDLKYSQGNVEQGDKDNVGAMLMALNLRSLSGALGSVLLFVAVHASATTITTTSFTTWEGSFITGSPTELNFYPINSTSYNTAAGITLSPSGSTLSFVFTGPIVW